ncbi:MAG: response regulator [Candidatus Falkowbacteria bacterium]|nr:response regulator [Candidatus Falkowbacteria bacterium]
MPTKPKTKGVVLIVEDDFFLLNIYSTKFEGENYKVSVASDGIEGLKLVKENNPDIILLDILMPKLDGFGFLKEIKKDEKHKDIPIILLTNLSQKNDIDKGLAMGADDYLVKAHFMPSEVVEKVESILKKKEKKEVVKKVSVKK